MDDRAEELIETLDRYLDARVSADRCNGENGTGRARLEARGELIELLRHYLEGGVKCSP